jgi:hypothetical protein
MVVQYKQPANHQPHGPVIVLAPGTAGENAGMVPNNKFDEWALTRHADRSCRLNNAKWVERTDGDLVDQPLNATGHHRERLNPCRQGKEWEKKKLDSLVILSGWWNGV